MARDATRITEADRRSVNDLVQRYGHESAKVRVSMMRHDFPAGRTPASHGRWMRALDERPAAAKGADRARCSAG